MKNLLRILPFYTKFNISIKTWSRYVKLRHGVTQQRCITLHSIQSRNWDTEFNAEVAKHIETEWRDKVTAVPEWSDEREKYYVLSMFPYPSGKLHMGHVRVYTISDVMARYQRMNGYQVIHPMGWDAFGLPAENAARDHGLPPDEWTHRNIESMRDQLQELCCCFDWNREVSTCDPAYYRWTQHIFLQMYDAGLVYRNQSLVNWDPVDETVLAEEQIDENGRSWRSGSCVEKRLLRQWFIRTTAYAQSLLDGLSEVDPVLWQHVVDLQRNWIGDCDGCNFIFPLQGLVNVDDICVGTQRETTGESKVKKTPLLAYISESYKDYLSLQYIKVTSYLKSVIEGLRTTNPRQWVRVLRLQESTTRCEYHLLMKTRVSTNEERTNSSEDVLAVHTVHPEAIFGVAFIALSPSHHYNTPHYYQDDRHLTEDFIPLKVSAIHPFTREYIPMFVSKTITFKDNTDTYLGIPSINEEDRAAAFRLGLSYRSVLDTHDRVSNSDQFSGLQRSEASDLIMKHARELGVGGHMTSAKLRDWLISRQRYWGTPIPIIHCPQCKVVPVPYSDLPVTLPKLDLNRNQKPVPLSDMTAWVDVKCPRCGEAAKRETDTMDTFVDSSWYFLRYLDPTNESEPFSKQLANRFMPVDLYIGGVEHAVLHLYFARFFTHFLHDETSLQVREPFKNLLTQGMVMGQSYRVKGSGRYISHAQVDFTGEKATERSSGEPLVIQWEKMSKSKHNGVDPQEIISEYGADSTRLCILSGVAPKSFRHWSSNDFKGVLSWQRRLWTVVMRFMKEKSSAAASSHNDEINLAEVEKNMFDSRNFFLKEVLFHLDVTFLLNTALARFHGFTNNLMKVPQSAVGKSTEFERALATLLVITSPFCPNFSSHLWKLMSTVASPSLEFNWDQDVLDQQWPQVDMSYSLPLIVKTNGQDLCSIMLPRKELDALTLERALELAEPHEMYQKYWAWKVPRSKQLRVDNSTRAVLSLVLEKPKDKRNVIAVERDGTEVYKRS